MQVDLYLFIHLFIFKATIMPIIGIMQYKQIRSSWFKLLKYVNRSISVVILTQRHMYISVY